MNCTEIKAGDRVWIGTYRDHRRLIVTVSRITPTQIVAGDGYYRYQRLTGARIGIGQMSIYGFATPEECARWDQKQADEQTAREARDRETADKEAQRKGMEALFQGSVTVHDAQWGTEAERAGKFDVCFYGLTEAGVRELAEKVKGGRP